MVRAPDVPPGVAGALRQEPGSLVGAAVVEDADRPVLAPHHEDRPGADLGGDEVAGSRHLALVPDVHPGVGEEVAHLEREHLFVDVDVAVDLGHPHEAGERLAIPCVLPPSKALRTRPLPPHPPGPSLEAAAPAVRAGRSGDPHPPQVTVLPGEYYGPW